MADNPAGPDEQDYDPAEDDVNSQDGDVVDRPPAPPAGSSAARAMADHQNDFEEPDESESESESDQDMDYDEQQEEPCSNGCQIRLNRHRSAWTDLMERHQRVLEGLRDNHATEVKELSDKIERLQAQVADLQKRLHARNNGARNTKKVRSSSHMQARH